MAGQIIYIFLFSSFGFFFFINIIYLYNFSKQKFIYMFSVYLYKKIKYVWRRRRITFSNLFFYHYTKNNKNHFPVFYCC